MVEVGRVQSVCSVALPLISHTCRRLDTVEIEECLDSTFLVSRATSNVVRGRVMSIDGEWS